MNICFRCPVCENPARQDLPATSEWQCPACDHSVRLPAESGESLPACLLCGNHELYRRKDFPHWLGLTILTVACVSFVLGNYFYHQWLAWTVLIASAVFDGLLYLWVRDVIVCYRCGAEYRGVPEDSTHKPFDLGVAERYRQERARREQLQAAKRTKEPQRPA